jgi:ribosomal protein S18 acetylase RimI-like enzyme
MSPKKLNINDQPCAADVEFLEEQINAYNVETTGIRDGGLLSLFVRNSAAEIVAGLYGWTWGGCCEIRYLWVHELLRRQGWGERLLLAAEQEAQKRGCGQVVLDTHSFQAPDFYQRLGYEIVGIVDGYPQGYQKYYLCKQLV